MDSNRDGKKLDTFRRKLVGWYESRRRTLPWRSNPTPYRVWISEIMLQQTQAETVLRYYDRFLRRFPNVESLARAGEAEVLQFWAGLGYYRRARNLLKAARQIAGQHKSFPRKFSAVLALPGIGRYTAGAICSIAFNQPYPVVDGNIRRVVSRLRGLTKRAPESYFWDVMSSWIHPAKPSAFNQGMMELGATACVPVHPRCSICPVSEFCETRRSGVDTGTWANRPTRPVKRIDIVALILQYRGSLLISAMEGGQLIPGKWGLPWETVAEAATAEENACGLCRSVLGRDVSLTPIPEVSHTITSNRITVKGFYGRLNCGIAARQSNGKTRWIRSSSRGKFLTSSLFHKVLAKSRMQ